jgi:hypothetical protein
MVAGGFGEGNGVELSRRLNDKASFRAVPSGADAADQHSNPGLALRVMRAAGWRASVFVT